jgi:hypothetical protein
MYNIISILSFRIVKLMAQATDKVDDNKSQKEQVSNDYVC